MALFKTLAELTESTKRVEKGDGEPRYFTLKGGESVRIRFRQELTQDSKNYDEEVGCAEVVRVHVSPSDFKKNGACTADVEPYKCWACEQVTDDFKWKPKPHVIINVALLSEDEEGNPAWISRILDQKFSSQHVGQDMVEFATNYGSLVDRDYIFKREGEGTKTEYKLTPLDKDDPAPAIADLGWHDVKDIHRLRPYAEQASYYLGSEDSDSSGGW